MQLISRKTKQYLSDNFTGNDQELAVMFFCGFICGAAIAFNQFQSGIDQEALKGAKTAFGDDRVFVRAKENFETAVKLINEGHEQIVLQVDTWIEQEAVKYQVRPELFRILMYGCRYGAIPMVIAYSKPEISYQQAIQIVLKSITLKHYCDALAYAAGDLKELFHKWNSI